MKNFRDILEEMPDGIEKSLGKVLFKHVGKEQAVNRDVLLAMLRIEMAPAKVDDRKMRAAINNLRNEGLRVCSCYIEADAQPVKAGRKTRFQKGYYIARTNREYEEFRERYLSYARSIWGATRSMDHNHKVLTPEGNVEPPAGMEVQGNLFAM